MNNRTGGRGQALAEFAIVVPILLLLFMGVFDFGRAVVMQTSLTNGVREGARLASVNQDKPTVTQRVLEQTFMSAPTTTVNYYTPPANPTATPTAPCGSFSGAGAVLDPPAKGCVIVVQSSAPYRAITPIIGDIIGNITLGASTTSRVEFSCPRPDDLSQPFTTAAQCPKQP
jgi:Flp pilus assembly protein TadG